MQDVLLLAVVAATFTFGLFLMKRLDRFLETNRHVQELQLQSDENTLRLGFCNPTVADSIINNLEKYSKLYPDISVRLFYGSEEELLKGLTTGKFNIIFLPENTEISAHMHYNFKVVSLNYTPIILKYGGFPIEPIADGHIIQNALWFSETTTPFVRYFMECLESKVVVPEQKNRDY